MVKGKEQIIGLYSSYDKLEQELVYEYIINEEGGIRVGGEEIPDSELFGENLVRLNKEYGLMTISYLKEKGLGEEISLEKLGQIKVEEISKGIYIKEKVIKSGLWEIKRGQIKQVQIVSKVKEGEVIGKAVIRFKEEGIEVGTKGEYYKYKKNGEIKDIGKTGNKKYRKLEEGEKLIKESDKVLTIIGE